MAWTALLATQGCVVALDWDVVEGKPSMSRDAAHARAGETDGGPPDAALSDAAADAQPGCLQYLDLDGDAFGDPTRSSTSCQPDEEYVLDAHDCNDDEAAVHPEATESCNGVDDDCDDEIDEGACPAGCKGAAFDGRSFMGCVTHLAYEAAAEECQRHDMRLADIYGAAENQFLLEFARAQGFTANTTAGVPDPYVWIGGSDRVEEGLWAHEDGQFFWHGDALGMALGHYQNWSSGEPNNNANPGEEDCLAMRGDDAGGWNDFRCANQAGFLCAKAAR